MKSNKLMFVKGALLLFIVTLLSLVKVEDVKAEAMISDATIEINDANSAADIDWDAIMSTLSDQQIVDGNIITVGDDYRLECEVIIDPTTSSLSDVKGADSSLSSASTASSYSTNYVATCNIFIYISGTNTHAATLTHSITVMFFTGNLVHISNGSLSVAIMNPNFTGTAYGYNIVNTDGTYSYAYGTVELYCSYNHLYYYYGAYVSVTPGSSPSFSFSQI